ncbi:MAG TPA: KTSC domain-containing protein [Actinocrinis sp.]|nr:KTSC domain-containing protein [Actinocrinis sp.]
MVAREIGARIGGAWMKRAAVDSSSLESVGYDPASRVMEIRFRNGGVYQYFGVAPVVYRRLMNAASKGRYFARAVRSAHPYRRVV